MKTFIYTFAAISMVSVSTVFSGVIYKDKYGKHRFPENDIFSIFIKRGKIRIMHFLLHSSRLCGIFMALLFVPAQAQQHFIYDIFQCTVAKFVIIATGDSTVSITCIDRSTRTHPLLSNDTLVIPNTVIHNGYEYQVEGIEDNAFIGCKDIKHLIISEGIDYIGENAFSYCTELQSIHIPSTIDYIGNTAFHSCPNLQTIEVHEKNERYDSRNQCNAIIEHKTDLILGCHTTQIPQGVTRICAEAFKGCLKLESITIPEGVVEMESGIFRNCLRLKYIKLPQTLETLSGGGTFADCINLRGIHIPQNVSFIEEGNQFHGCPLLDSITVDSRNKTYDSRDGCNAIVETATDKIISGCGKTRIVGSIKEIGSSAFGNSMIKSITIPANITKIHNGAFWGCRFCTSISVDPRNPVYDSRNDCNAIIETATHKIITGCITTDIPQDVVEIGERAFSRMPLPTFVAIPDNIQKIGENAFAGCEGIYQVFIPGSVKEIGAFAFSLCNSLNGVLMEKGIKKISSGTFSQCKNLNLIEIPEGVKKIDRSAFWNCSNLQYVSLPSSLEHIASSAFDGCPCDSLITQNMHAITY